MSKIPGLYVPSVTNLMANLKQVLAHIKNVVELVMKTPNKNVLKTKI
jgi:hypothetical protein